MSDPNGNDHDSMDLSGLLKGEASRSEVLAMAGHLRSCDECRLELIDLAVAHASLASAARTGRTFAAPMEPEGDLPPLPTLDDRGKMPTTATSGRRSQLWRLALVAAALVLVASLGTAFALARQHQGSTVVAQATLHPMDGPADASGSLTALAEGSDRALTVRTDQLDALTSQTYYEVWLLNPTTLKMLPVGVLPPSGTGTFTMDASLMTGYSAVDISLQVNDGDPAHSKVSVLRGYF
jgi:hypothetical protein